jgi:serine protease
VGADAESAAPEDLGPVTVALRTANTHGVVATTSARVEDGYRFAFENVPSGDYEIVASTDHDGDGEFCDVGDECGAYPERAAPISISVFGGDVVRARDFPLSLVVDPF